MKNISKYKVHTSLLVTILLFAIISVITIYSASLLINDQTLYIKQIIWYILGFFLAYIIMTIGNKFIYNHAFLLYIFGVLTLLAILLFAPSINNIRSWFVIPGVGTIQPSEFMKIILIIMLAKVINEFHENNSNPDFRDELKLIIKVIILTFIPSILTFLQPDTGVVLIYLIIMTTMLFISGIKYQWFLIFGGVFTLLIGVILGVYFTNDDLFIKLFGTDFFLRVDRLLDWSSQSGFQLENGMTAIASGGLFGHGFAKTPIYFPEPQTDFIFAVFGSNFGLIGSLFLISLIAFFDIKLISLVEKTNYNIDKFVISGIIGMLIYQQVQNIGMTIGLLPITGITLPFISYGGSSLLSYMIMLGILFNISNAHLRYTN
jgi:rod shape determining protein RodA